MESSERKGERSGIGTRAIALFALAGVVSALGYAAHQGYLAATDSFVAPIILSPDSDVVLASKLKMSELEVERAKTVAAAEAIDMDVAACDAAIEKLAVLKSSTENALAWTTKITANQAYAGGAELGMLANQRSVLSGMIAQQTKLVDAAKANMTAGLISQTDYARDAQALEQMRLALLDNGRARIQSALVVQQAALAQRSLGARGDAPVLPEAIARREQVVRIELETMKLESEKRTKLTEKRVVEEKLAKIDEVAAQLRARPMFRAAERSIEVAFVPYTQSDGVNAGASVYACTWGLFNCRPVGSVGEVVPGEVILPDPWGNQARGHYAVLDLKDHGAARSKVLRIRAGGGASSPSPSRPAVALSSASR